MILDELMELPGLGNNNFAPGLNIPPSSFRQISRSEGSSPGQPCQEGVYTWVIRGTSYMKDVFHKAGTVTLIR